jgi:glycosyltransferase involved in cell wall biosynthesis
LDIFDQPIEVWRPEGVNRGDLMAIFTGTHGLANGLDAVIAVASELKQRGRDDIKLVLVGDGMQKPALQQQAHRLELNNIIFHDPVNKQQLAALMAGADIGMQILAMFQPFIMEHRPINSSTILQLHYLY